VRRAAGSTQQASANDWRIVRGVVLPRASVGLQNIVLGDRLCHLGVKGGLVDLAFAIKGHAGGQAIEKSLSRSSAAGGVSGRIDRQRCELTLKESPSQKNLIEESIVSTNELGGGVENAGVGTSNITTQSGVGVAGSCCLICRECRKFRFPVLCLTWSRTFQRSGVGKRTRCADGRRF
jgi:hypothetical protein